MTDLSDTDKQRLFRSSAISAGFWLLVALLLLLVPIDTIHKKEAKYRDVSIILTPPAVPPQVATPSLPEPKRIEKNEQKQEPKPVQATKTPAPSSPKTIAPKKASPTVNKSSPANAAPAAAGLGIPNFSTPVTSSSETTGPEEYLDFSSNAPATHSQIANRPAGGTPASEFEGAAASVQKKGNTSVSGTSVGSTETVSSGAPASIETAKSLDAIADAAKTGTQDSVNDTASSVASVPQTAKSTPVRVSNTSMLSDISFEGAPRRLLRPSKPAIILPDRLARLIDSNRTVTVQFTVRPDGTVPSALIYFTPSAILPAEIRDYLRKEFSSWMFEKSDGDGQASFHYSIKVE